MKLLEWLTKLFEKSADDKVSIPKWMAIAIDDIGVIEFKGKKHNKRILEYHANTPNKFGTDEVPWCASAVTTWLEEAGMKSAKTAWSKAYLEYGEELEEPRLGCIVVFYRDFKNSNKGHVGFYMGKVRDTILVLGGNQSDAVTIQEYAASRLLGCRWPVERRI